MAKLPVVSGKEVIKALNKLGYEFDHQRGSHIILRQSLPPYRRLTIPNHKVIAKGTLKSIIKEAGITTQLLIDLL